MSDLAWSLFTVVAWGVWLAPLSLAGAMAKRTETLFITLGNLGIAALVAAAWGFSGLTPTAFAASAMGGVIWAISGVAAVSAIQSLGIARAMGLWAPLNILVSLVWGAVLFGELRGLDAWAWSGLLIGVPGMIAGVWIIVIAPGTTQERGRADRGLAAGLAAAALAGLGWGSYFVPIRLAEASPWVASFPLAVGMSVGAGALWLVGNHRPHRAIQPEPLSEAWKQHLLAASAGLLWAAGNYGSLQMMEGMGTGRGFAIAQACVVVNALVGVFVLRRPAPGTRAATLTLVGVAIAATAAACLGISR